MKSLDGEAGLTDSYQGLYEEPGVVKQGVSQTPTKGCIKSPDGEARSLGLTDSYQGLYEEMVKQGV